LPGSCERADKHTFPSCPAATSKIERTGFETPLKLLYLYSRPSILTQPGNSSMISN
jgi:hypothetical protein